MSSQVSLITNLRNNYLEPNFMKHKTKWNKNPRVSGFLMKNNKKKQ